MKLEKIERLIALLRNNGVSHFKSDGLEIEINLMAPVTAMHTTVSEKDKAPSLQAIPPVQSEIPHHVNEVSNLLKLSDSDLVDKLFPDYSQMEAKEA